MFGIPTESVPHLVSATQRRKENMFGRQSRRCRQKTRNSYGTVTKRTKQDGSRSGSAKQYAQWKRAERDDKRCALEEEEMRCQFDETDILDPPVPSKQVHQRFVSVDTTVEEYDSYDYYDVYDTYITPREHAPHVDIRHRLEQYLVAGRLTDILDLFKEEKINLGDCFLWEGTECSSFRQFPSRMPTCVGQTTHEVMEYLLENEMDHLLAKNERVWRKMLLSSSDNGLWEFVLHHSAFMCRFGYVAMECAAHRGNLDLVKHIHETHPSWYKSDYLNNNSSFCVSRLITAFFSSATLEIGRYLVSTFPFGLLDSTGYSWTYYGFGRPSRIRLQNFKPEFVRALFENYHVLETEALILVWSEFRWHLSIYLRRKELSILLRHVFWPYSSENSRSIDLGKCWKKICLCILESEYGSRDGYDYGNIENLVIEFVGMGLIDALLPVEDDHTWEQFAGNKLLIGWEEKNARDVVLELLRRR